MTAIDRNLSDEEVKVVWAALVAMTLDVHAPQDNLSEEEWAVAERLTSELTSMLDDDVPAGPDRPPP